MGECLVGVTVVAGKWRLWLGVVVTGPRCLCSLMTFRDATLGLLAAAYEPMDGCLESCNCDRSRLKLDCAQPNATPGGLVWVSLTVCVSSTWKCKEQ